MSGTGESAAKKPRLDPVRAPSTTEQLADFIKKGNQTNLLFTFGTGWKAGFRNVVGTWEYVTVPVPRGLPMPTFATQSHTAPGAKPGFGENSGMIDDYAGARKAVSVLLGVKEIMELMKAAYGADFFLADDRGHYRFKKLTHDLQGKGRRDLLSLGHVDWPTWLKRDVSDIPVQAAAWADNELCIIALRQCAAHSIPLGGHTRDDEMILGWFVSPLSSDKYDAYCAETIARLRKEMKPGAKAKYAWPGLRKIEEMFKDDPDLAKYLFAAAIAFGLRPVLYPSKKVINVPQSYCGAVYKHFEGYKPDSSKQVIDPVAEVAKIKDPEIRFYFEQVHKALPNEKFACHVSELSDEYLRRTLGFSAAVASDGAGDDESDDESAVSTYVSTIESALDVGDLGDFTD